MWKSWVGLWKQIKLIFWKIWFVSELCHFSFTKKIQIEFRLTNFRFLNFLGKFKWRRVRNFVKTTCDYQYIAWLTLTYRESYTDPYRYIMKIEDVRMIILGISWQITCSWHQKNETTNSRIQSAAKCVLKALKWKSKS